MSSDTWAERLHRAVRNFLPWPHFPALVIKAPLQRLAPVMDDDDTDAWGDVLYCRGLLDDIEAECKRTQSRIRLDDRAMAATLLDVALELVAREFDFPMPVAAGAALPEGEAA